MNSESGSQRRRIVAAGLWTWLGSAAFMPAFASDVVNDIAGADPMVPFDRYLQPSSYDGPQLSPDGRHIAVLAPVDGVTNLMIADVTKPAELHPLTHDHGRGM